MNSLKLDFNERSDSKPNWLDGFEVKTNDIWQYPDSSACELIIANQNGIYEKSVMLTNGGDEAIEIIFKFTKLNDYKVILPLPAFSQYLVGLESWKINNQLINPTEGLRVDLEMVNASITKRSLIILTSPNNPTGEWLSVKKIEKICSKAQAMDSLVLLDQAYIEFVAEDIDWISWTKKFSNLIVLRTFSKAYGLAGARIGYLLANEKLMDDLRALALPFRLSVFDLQLVNIALNPEAKQEVANYCKAIEVNRKVVTARLDQAGLNVAKSRANFILITGNTSKLKLIAAACNKLRILIKDKLSTFYTDQSNPYCLRITIPTNINPLLKAINWALKPDLLCIDMDGVLIDTSQSYDIAISKTVLSLTDKEISKDEATALRASGGFNNDWELTAELIRQAGAQTSFEKVKTEFQRFYLGDIENQGLCESERPIIESKFSAKLFSGKNIKTAIVTGRPKYEALQGMQLLNIKNTILISDDDVKNSKPEPEGINKAKQYFQTNFSWMLGDTPDDIEAAKKSGSLAIGVGSECLYKFGADLVIKNINQLDEILSL